MRSWWFFASFFFLLLIAGCGGGGSEGAQVADASIEEIGGNTLYGVSYDGSVLVGANGISSFIWTELSGLSLILGSDEGGTDISDDGQTMCGYSPSQGAFRWTSGVGTTFLGNVMGYDVSEAYGISGDGTIVAGQLKNIDDGITRAFQWIAGSGVVTLGTLPGGGNVYARGISSDGNVIVGFAMHSDDHFRAFRWTSGGGMLNLGLLSGDESSFATAASADGSVVVGYSRDPDSTKYRAFRWTNSGGMQQIGSGVWSMEALDVSDDGNTVIGIEWIGDSIGANRSWVWTASNGLKYLPVLAGDTFARKVSGNGRVIVGEAENASGNFVGVRWILN
ncbi:MAG: hypothetical protein KF824_01815 [Fimbriimonadaceae bacterium]|nr:MAG: hypothetical protein KF824_01815 [Fimbriimonadaceae bacterium]